MTTSPDLPEKEKFGSDLLQRHTVKNTINSMNIFGFFFSVLFSFLYRLGLGRAGRKTFHIVLRKCTKPVKCEGDSVIKIMEKRENEC